MYLSIKLIKIKYISYKHVLFKLIASNTDILNISFL